MKREQFDSSAFFIVYGLRNTIKQDGNNNNPKTTNGEPGFLK
ncbi:hypothetical protein [Psychromonas sp. MB-3u-54]|nr:hypothetical protein [Psychromonas sp. MB-3u-54]